jgi:hypothetical protein
LYIYVLMLGRKDGGIRPFLAELTSRQAAMLLLTLQQSGTAAMEFDSRSVKRLTGE